MVSSNLCTTMLSTDREPGTGERAKAGTVVSTATCPKAARRARCGSGGGAGSTPHTRPGLQHAGAADPGRSSRLDRRTQRQARGGRQHKHRGEPRRNTRLGMAGDFEIFWEKHTRCPVQPEEVCRLGQERTTLSSGTPCARPRARLPRRPTAAAQRAATRSIQPLASPRSPPGSP